MQVEREVAAPPERVWEVVTDIERWPEISDAVVSVERLDSRDSFGVGTRWRETRRIMGREASEEMEVTAVDAGRSYTAEADSRGAHYVSVVTVEPIAEQRTRLAMSFEVEPQGFVARVMVPTVGKLLEGPTRKALEKDLDDLARAAEQNAT